MTADFARLPGTEPSDLPIQFAPIKDKLPQGWVITMVETTAHRRGKRAPAMTCRSHQRIYG